MIFSEKPVLSVVIKTPQRISLFFTSPSGTPPPSPEIIATLLDFTRIGDVRGLTKALEALDDDLIAPKTAVQLNKLIENYQIAELEALLQSYLP